MHVLTLLTIKIESTRKITHLKQKEQSNKVGHIKLEQRIQYQVNFTFSRIRQNCRK